jgi:protein-disulfide isomerase/uncharacterized membrane protein
LGPNAKTRLAAALCLCLAGAAVSGVLLLQHHGEPGAVSAVNEACGDGQTSGCEDVARSAWSSFAGLPVAAYGLAFYLSLALLLALALAVPAERRAPLAALALGALALALLVDLVLLGVQAFAIRSYCALCLLTYALGATALFALLPARAAARAAGGLAAAAEARVALAGWALGTAAVAAAVLAGNGALVARAALRQATLLGAPATDSAPPPSVPAALPADASDGQAATEASPDPAAADPEAKAWRDRAERLQATLDDPQKLEAYFAEKAQREFEASAPVSIDTSGIPPKGPATAPVKVVEFSDFLCPFCRNLGLALSQFVPQAGGRVAVYFMNYPLDNACNPRLPRASHPGSCHLALGAVCARNQGKFDAYHDRVFQSELRNPQAADVVRMAGEAGLNAAAMEGCLADPQTRRTLEAEIAEGNRLDINATPTVFVNGRKLPRLNDFVAVVDTEARKQGFPPLGQ